MNLKEWIRDKKNRPLLIGGVALLSAVLLVFVIVGQIIKSANTLLSKDILTATKTEIPEVVDDGTYRGRVICPTMDYSVATTLDAEVKEDALIMFMDKVYYVVEEGDSGIEDMCQFIFPDRVISTLVNYVPQVNVQSVEEGYAYSYKASYCSSTVEAMTTYGKENYYAICYEIDLGGINSLYFYATSKEREAINNAHKEIGRMVALIRKESKGAGCEVLNENVSDTTESLSVSEVKEVAVQTEHTTTEEEKNVIPPQDYVHDGENIMEQQSALTTEDYYIINSWIKEEKGHEETLFLLEWMNLDCVPMELVITGPNGQVGVLLEEYSMPGHYVYDLGFTTEGKYYIEGKTKEQLLDVTLGVMSKEGYLEIYHWYENPDNTRAHEGIG